jgi:hypothetical protein
MTLMMILGLALIVLGLILLIISPFFEGEVMIFFCIVCLFAGAIISILQLGQYIL